MHMLRQQFNAHLEEAKLLFLHLVQLMGTFQRAPKHPPLQCAHPIISGISDADTEYHQEQQHTQLFTVQAKAVPELQHHDLPGGGLERDAAECGRGDTAPPQT